MTDLPSLVGAWHQTGANVVALLRDLEAAEWARATDCPEWTVRDVAAHLAAIEHELATGEGPSAVDARAREVVSSYTQAGVEARRGRSPGELVDELEAAVAERSAQLDAADLSDPSGTPDRTPGAIAWDWQTLLRNRVVDVWVHEQDIRRAVDRPGGMDDPGAAVTTAVFVAALPYVIGKRLAPAPGTTITVLIGERATAYSVDEDGRCRPTAPADGPTVSLRMSRETFTMLAAGRAEPDRRQVAVTGDLDLAEQLLRSLAVTP